MNESANKTGTLAGPQPETGTDRPERRSTERFPFTESAEIIDIASKTRVAGRSSDLSAEGCYVDTISPFAAGALVLVRMNRGPQIFEAKGVVRYSLVSMGMGLSFTEIKPVHKTVLQRWIAELRGDPIPEPEQLFESSRAVPEIARTGVSSEVGTLRQVVNELINLMIRKKVIDEEEGMELLRQMFR